MLTDHKKIHLWLKDHHVVDPNSYIITDGVVNTTAGITINGCIDLPVRFGTIGGNFGFTGLSFTESFEVFPHTIEGHFSMYTAKNNSMHDLYKVLKHIKGSMVVNNESTHLLGLLLIEGVTKLDIDRGPIDTILNKYLGTGDILSAQDELIDAGFIDQARL
jgi:hypothetical protein